MFNLSTTTRSSIRRGDNREKSLYQTDLFEINP